MKSLISKLLGLSKSVIYNPTIQGYESNKNN